MHHHHVSEDSSSPPADTDTDIEKRGSDPIRQHHDPENSHENHESHDAMQMHDQHENPKHDHSKHNMSGHEHMHDMGGDRPIWATVFIGVSHCGAGCVLGDLVGEWLVYGTGAMIRGHDIWPCILIDYAFALLFGIIFQYFSIAPMSGDYGPKTIIRAAKADILSLTAFEIGLFGWMIIYQVGIWEYKLPMNTFTYWWQMQIGMFFGFWTALPVNWWLLTRGIKEPCA